MRLSNFSAHRALCGTPWQPLLRLTRRAAHSRAAAARPDAALPTTFPRGLTGAGATDRFYTSELDLEQPLLLRGSGDFHVAARADARERAGLRGRGKLSNAAAAEVEESARAHIRAAAVRCREFILSGAVHGRAELKGVLAALCEGEGALGLLLGGKSVGKSLLLSELARRTDLAGSGGKKRAILYVDARRCGMDLCSGLARALDEEAEELLRSGLLQGPRRTQNERGTLEPSSTPVPSRVQIGFDLMGMSVEGEASLGAATVTTAQRNVAALARALSIVEAKGMYLCLVVDEVNLALPLPPVGTGAAPSSPQQHATMQDTRLLLEYFVALTKQSNAVNVLLVSSEYAFPYRLQHNNFFNASNLTHVIFAGEVSPADMRGLLRNSWGLGPHLSDVFLAFYGGHVHMAARALAALDAEAGDFNCASVAPTLAAHQIDACMEASAAVAPLLRQLALRGFARVEGGEGAEAAQLLARANVAGLVDTSAKVLGLPLRVREGAAYGLVPSSHFMVRGRTARSIRGGAFVWLHDLTPFHFPAPPF